MRWVLALVLTGCNTIHLGTGVGNPGEEELAPGDVTSRVADAGDVTVTSAVASVADARLYPCDDGTVAVVPVDETWDLVGGGQLGVPGGRWCGVALRLDDLAEVRGERSDILGTHTFALHLDVPVVSLTTTSPQRTTDASLYFEVGAPGWLSGAATVLFVTDVDIGPGDPGHDTLAARLALGSALFLDPDGDGELSDAERRDGRVAEGDDYHDHYDDDDWRRP